MTWKTNGHMVHVDAETGLVAVTRMSIYCTLRMTMACDVQFGEAIRKINRAINLDDDMFRTASAS